MFVSAIASCVGWRAAFVFQKDKPLGNTASVAGVAGKRGRHQMPNKDKLVIGAALATFVKENSWALTQDGTFTNGALKQFCRKYPQLEHRRKDNRFFKRCLGLLGRAGVRSKGKRTSNGALLGRNCKAQAIRDDLFQWFCSIRGSVKGRIPVMLMRTVANSIKERYLIACLRARVVPSAPDVDNKWIARFCKEMCISLRTPNKRWLLPHHMYCDRMRVLWCLGQALPLEWLLFWGGGGSFSITRALSSRLFLIRSDVRPTSAHTRHRVTNAACCAEVQSVPRAARDLQGIRLRPRHRKL